MAQQTLVVVLTITLVLITLMLIGVACKCHTLAVVTEEPHTVTGNARFSRKLRLARGVQNNTIDTNTCQPLTSMHIKGTGSGIQVSLDGIEVAPTDFTTIMRSGDLPPHVYYPLPFTIAYIDVAIKHTYKNVESPTLPYITLPDAQLRPHGALLNITIHDILFPVEDSVRLTETPFSIRAPVAFDSGDISYITDKVDRSADGFSSPQIRWGGQKVHVLTVAAPTKATGAARLLLRSHILPFPQNDATYVWTIEHFGYVTATGSITTSESGAGTVTATLQAS